MPLVDMPLASLLEYKGRNPRPADFDAYWDAAIRELDATPPQPKIAPATFNLPNGATCLDLTFRGVGNASVYAKCVKPAGLKPGQKVPAVCMFHGYSGHSGDWMDKLGYASAGFVVLAMDVRGQGGKSQDSGTVIGTTLNGHIVRGVDDPDPAKLFYRSVYLDCAQLARIALSMPEVDASRVYATGWSQGGGLTLACGAIEPRVAKIAPVYPFLCDYRRVWEMDLAKDAYAEIGAWFRNFDPTHAREDAFFERLGYIDCQHLAPRIRAKTMLGVGLMDTVCPPSTQFAAYNRISAPKSFVKYPDFGHGGLPGHHDRILQFLCEG